jgi:NAD+ diphosphatase
MEEIYCFAGNPLDRASERRRDQGWVAGLLDLPETRILPLYQLMPEIADMARPRLEWQPADRWRTLIAEGATAVLLGLGERCAHFALDCSHAAAPAARSDARSLAPLLPAAEAAILAEARSLIDWHTRHRFCANCGSPTRIGAAGWTRACPECKAQHYPRVDPVVITLAVRGERGLLGRNRRRAGARFSCLAGYVEPGETPEEAVRREVLEESGIRLGRVRYLAAQPWPFPSTLMMGFIAEAVSEEITVDPEELAEARWFERDEIRRMVERAAAGDPPPNEISLPGPVAIAHQICRRWAFGLDGV